MNRHMPGPWIVDQDNPRKVFTQSDLEFVADCDGLGNDPKDIANARLIAAAPELLEALRALVMADPFNWPTWSAAARRADAALAKAEGQS